MKYLATLIAGLGLYCASVSCHAPTSEGSTTATADTTVEAAIKPMTFNLTGMT
jgi:hypothetical protein